MPPANALSLLLQITRWIVLQKARRHPIKGLRLLVRTQFQVLFHSPSGVLLTFPSRYLFSIDHKIYLALGGGPPGFKQDFSCPVLLDQGGFLPVKRLAHHSVNIRLAILNVLGFHYLWLYFPEDSTRLANF